MKILFALIVLTVAAASIYADYRWRRWMADRRRNRNQQDS